MNNKKAKVFVERLLSHSVIRKLTKIDDAGVPVSTHTYDVLMLSIEKIIEKYKSLENAKSEVDLFAILIGVIMHDESKVTIRLSGERFSHSYVMNKEPNRIKNEVLNILDQVEDSGMYLLNDVRKKIVGIVLSHHGRWGFVKPSCIEDEIVHEADVHSAAFHRIYPISAMDIVKLISKGYSEIQIMNKLKCGKGLIKDRLKRSKEELGVRYMSQLVKVYEKTGDVPLGDEIFTCKLTETKMLLEKVEKEGFERLIRKSSIIRYLEDDKIFI